MWAANSGNKRPVAAGRIVPYLLVALAVILCYGATVSYDLVWDDRGILSKVAGIVDRDGVAGLFWTDWFPGTVYYRPLTLISFWADSRLAAFFPPAFHLTSILLHLAVSILVLRLLLRLFPKGQGPLWGALLFAVHPVHVESVAFVSGRTDLLASFFVLLSLLAWLRWREGTTARGRWLAAAAITFFLACMSKEVAFIFPITLLAWDRLAFPGGGEIQGWWRRNRSWLGAFTAMAALYLPLFLVLGNSLSRTGGVVGGIAAGAGDLRRVPLFLCKYLSALVIPFPHKVVYDTPDLSLGILTIVGCLLYILAHLAIRGHHGRVVVWASLAWTMAFLLPTSGLLAGKNFFWAERFLYLPSVGTSLLLSSLLGTRMASPTAPRREWAWAVFLAVLLAFLAVTTSARNGDWKDEKTLFSRIAADSPDSPSGYYNLGMVLFREGRREEAIKAFGKAVNIRPLDPQPLLAMGRVMGEGLGRWQDAATTYRKALDIDPRQAPVWNRLGVALLKQGLWEEGVSAYRKAIDLDPGDPDAHGGVTVALRAMGREAEAQKEEKRFLELGKEAR